MILAVSGPLLMGAVIIAALVVISVLLRGEDRIEREEREAGTDSAAAGGGEGPRPAP